MSRMGLEKAEEPEIKLPTITGSWRKAREFQKQTNKPKKQKQTQKNPIYSFTEYTKYFDCVDHKKPWKILKEMRVPPY